jgi:transketolase
MRRTLAKLIQEKLDSHNCVLLAGDVGYSVLDELKGHPRFLNCGSSEQLMVAMAAGLSLSGVFPVVYGITPFVTARALEQIKICLCYQNTPCLIVGTGSGFAYGHLGPTHHSLEDISLLKSLPSMKILAPCDKADLTSCIEFAFKADAPCYLRMPHEHVSLISQEAGIGLKKVKRTTAADANYHFAVVTYGAMVQSCLMALGDDLPFDLYNLNCLDYSVNHMNTLQHYEIVIFVEEAYQIGGFGESLLVRLPMGVKGMHRAVESRFPTTHGSREYLLEQAELDVESLRKLFYVVSNTEIMRSYSNF